LVVAIFGLFVYTTIVSALVFKSSGDVVEVLLRLIAIGVVVCVCWPLTIPIAAALGLGYLISKKK
jgi:hypothetical protein